MTKKKLRRLLRAERRLVREARAEQARLGRLLECRLIIDNDGAKLLDVQLADYLSASRYGLPEQMRILTLKLEDHSHATIRLEHPMRGYNAFIAKMIETAS